MTYRKLIDLPSGPRNDKRFWRILRALKDCRIDCKHSLIDGRKTWRIRVDPQQLDNAKGLIAKLKEK